MKPKYKLKLKHTGEFLANLGQRVGKQAIRQGQLIRAQQIRDQKSLDRQTKKAGKVKNDDWRNGFKVEMKDLDFQGKSPIINKYKKTSTPK